jgi:alkylhydroperoxidase family enzyme
VRFDSAREAGLDEHKASLVDDGYAEQLGAKEAAAVALADALIGIPQPLSPQLQERLRAHFTPAELAELTLGVGLFLGMSKVLITLGLEPEDMPVTVVPTPGS